MSEDKLDLILGELRGMRGELTEVKEDVRGLKKDVQTLKGDVQTLKSDVQTLKSDMQTLKDGMVAVRKRLDSHEDMLVQLIGIVRSTNERVSHLADLQEAHRPFFAPSAIGRGRTSL
ncbi:hypothetical protein [Cohnella thermotolerans]|uniref:hypothetical protein n=1 Tax=Cohnella thermotolerans TaxID=329858 RepID=UPI000414A007|nr:hypothetical protein [Cohnella thermotolerans]